ncbi:MAG: dephospho-CoA kinase [Actinomycetota bacterium]|nr:dephospho-CoA kinase [Actinomycetota bacterium]
MIRSAPSMLVVGLTGGIGSGKSTVAALLEAKGATVIDADSLAREVVAPGTPGFGAVVARFGGGVVGPDGGLDRQALADVVFSDPNALTDLNAIVHPAVRSAIDHRLAALGAGDGVVVLEIPLLVESGRSYGAAAVIVVDCPEEVALRRLVGGRGMDEADARRRMAAQLSRDDRLAAADIVIDNTGSRGDLDRQVDEVWRRIPTFAPPPPPNW